jgi:hypothetical protein
MHLLALTSLPLAALLLGACNALPTNSVVLEKIESSPSGWTLDPAANEDKESTTLTLKVHLVNQGMNDFHKLALDVRKYPSVSRCAPWLNEHADCDSRKRSVWQTPRL